MYAQDEGHGAGGAPGEIDQVLTPAAIEAARYICRKLPGVPKTSFVKYLYLADREYALRHGRTLLGTGWWLEDQGPLSSAVTKLIRGPEFRVEESKTAFDNSRLGHVEVADTPLRQLGSAEIAVLDMVVAEFGGLSQAELLQRVHDLAEVKTAQLKQEIGLPRREQERGSSDYVSDLLTELSREHSNAIYDLDFAEDEAERSERSMEARSGVIALD
jgi:antitoxin SocA-like protein